MDATLRAREHLPDPALPLSVRRYVVDRDAALHGHDFHELVIIISGSAGHQTRRWWRPAR